MLKPILFSVLLVICSWTQAEAQSRALNRANKHYELHDYKEAIKDYHEVLAEEADQVEALTKLAACYFHLNQLTQAKKYFEQAVRERGFEPQYMLPYAKTLMSLEEYDAAKQWFLLYGEGFPITGEQYAAACDIAKNRRHSPPAYTVEPVEINGADSEFGATFFGDVVVYGGFAKRLEGEAQDEQLKNILYLSAIDEDGQMQQPTFLFRNKMANYYGVGPVSFSENGKWVAFMKQNFRSGIRQIPTSGIASSLFIAEVTPDGQWKNAVPFPHNGSGYSTGYPSFSADGQTLYFASDRPDGLGGFDIYVSTKRNGEWSVPTNLGAPVNTPGDEITPYFTGNTLYFSSDWHHGLGGFDIFRAEKGVGTWEKVFHQGTGVNSARDDYGFVYDATKNVGFFTSNRPQGKGLEDIYKVAKAYEKFLVTVVDETTKQPVSGVQLDFTTCGQRITTTDAKGQFSFQAPQGFDCTITVSKDGFATQTKRIKSDGLKGMDRVEVAIKSTENKHSFVGRTIQAGTPEPLEGVYITATNIATGLSTETKSDAQGYYTLLLGLQQNYTLRFSKAGYSEVERLVKTKTGEDKSILDVTSMLSASTAIPVSSDEASPTDTPVVDTAPPPAPTSPAPEPDTSSEPEPTPPPVVKSEPAPDSPPAPSLSSGYAVQIAALPVQTSFDKNKYVRAEKWGTIYTKKDAIYQRVRVGIYASKTEATRVQNALRAAGFDGAYLVSEKGVEAPVVKPPHIPATPPPAVPSTSDKEAYYVRLGAYRNPDFFDDKGLSIYGDVVRYAKGPFTIILLEAGTKIGRARVIREKAKEKGFDGAYIVVKKGTEYVRA